MERLTFLNGDETPCVCDDKCYEEQSGHYCGPAIDRLAAYEKTGMTPGDVHSLWGEWDAMMSVLNSIGSYDRLRELAEADKEGRVVVLPCKLGSVVYTISGGEVIEKCAGRFKVRGYTRPEIWAELDCGWEVAQYVRWDVSVGIDFFLTREEAEKALEEKKDD